MAEEVRNLAQRSAEAAKNTANMIAESVKNSEEGVKIANNVAKSFEAISGSNAKVDSLIAEIAAASREQAQGIDQVNTAVAQMDKVAQQNAASSEESVSAAEELSSQAEEPQGMVGQFILSQSTVSASFNPDKKVPQSRTIEKSYEKEITDTNRRKNGNRKIIPSKSFSALINKTGKSACPEDLLPLADDSVLKEF